MNTALRRALVRVRPRTWEQLHAWVRCVLEFDIVRTPMIEGHAAPFDYLAHAFFGDFHDSDIAETGGRDAVVWANRGGGKTQVAAIATLLDLLFKPGIEVRVIGGSFDQAQRMHEYLARMLELPELAALVDGRVMKHGVRLVNGSRVGVLAQSERAVRGQRVHRLRCDEVELFDDDVWEAAQLVTRSGLCGGVFVQGGIEALSTMHEPNGLMRRLVRDHSRRQFRWSVLDVLARCETSRPCGQCSLEPGCCGRAKMMRGFVHIDDAIQQQGRVGFETWNAEMLCDRPRTRDRVFPTFDPQTHVERFEAPVDAQWYGGVDFGFRDPTVFLWAFKDAAGSMRVIDEVCERQETCESMLAKIRKRPWPAVSWVGADPAGHQRSEQTGMSTIAQWRRAGMVMKTRRTSIEAGLNAVRARLRSGDGKIRLVIHPRCATLLESLESYHYAGGAGDEKPAKDGSDHACDALRYLIVNLDNLPGGFKRVRY